MTAKQFRRWRRRSGLSLTGAARALGISRRTVEYYQVGTYPVQDRIAVECDRLAPPLLRRWGLL